LGHRKGILPCKILAPAIPTGSSLGDLHGTRGYWRQRADERLGDPPPKVDPGAFSSQRQGWNTPRGPSLLLCV